MAGKDFYLPYPNDCFSFFFVNVVLSIALFLSIPRQKEEDAKIAAMIVSLALRLFSFSRLKCYKLCFTMYCTMNDWQPDIDR